MPTEGDIYYFASRGGKAAAPPLIFIHGAGGDHLHWPHALRRLPGYRVFAPDLPGHGKSGGLGEQDVAAYAKKIIEWMYAIGVYRAVFAGHSMGGAIALTLALDHPEHAMGLVLVGTGAKLRVNPYLMEKLSMRGTFPTAVEAIVEWCYAGDADEQLKMQVKKQLLGTRPSVLHGDYIACNAFDLMARLGEIRVPACVLCGAEDKMTPPKYSEYLAANIPNAKLALIPNAGHMVMLEQPEAVGKEVEAFLAGVSL